MIKERRAKVLIEKVKDTTLFRCGTMEMMEKHDDTSTQRSVFGPIDQIPENRAAIQRFRELKGREQLFGFTTGNQRKGEI